MSHTQKTVRQPARKLPAEWAPQSGVMLTWPRPDSDWEDHLPEAEAALAELTAQISRREQVLISCDDQTHQRHITTLLTTAGADHAAITFQFVPANDVWVRDHGPITVLADGKPLLLDFTFNGWGGKYAAELDNHLTRTLHSAGVFGDTPITSSRFVLEGGSIDSDGEGTLLTTTSCLLGPGRNLGWSRQQIEEELRETLGIDRVLWLKHGWLAGDDTDGHVDMLARFCDANTIAYTACHDAADEHYPELNAMAAELAALRDGDGKPYKLIALPLPAARFNEDGKRLPASYANFLIINGAVLLPVYDDKNTDAYALAALRAAFPHHEIVAVPALALIRQYGSLHCATMQLPQGVLA
ncbi:MAG: agmatine deiminase family protein [Chromatiales bacterium]|jgi:agmatine deiminase|nr:agmatine deiminase family protein [Chromatiales bacterium]